MGDLSHSSVQAPKSTTMNDKNIISSSEIQEPTQQPKLDFKTPSTRSNSCSARQIQQNTSGQKPQGYEILWKKLQSHDLEIKALREQLGKISEKSQSREAISKIALPFRNIPAAIFHWLAEQHPENNTRGTGISEIDIKLANNELFVQETTGTQGDEQGVVETGENPYHIDIEGQTDYRDATQVPNANAPNHQKIGSDSETTGTHLQSENSVLRASLFDLEQRCAKHESEIDLLITEHRAHRCTNGDELDIPDNELEESFLGLETRIADLFEYCHASQIDLNTIKEMSKACLVTTQPSWWDLVLDERKRVFWLRGLLANALYEEFFDKRFFFDVDGKGEIKAGLTNFEKILVQGNSGVLENQVAEWRARTFRLTELIAKKQGRNPSARVREVAEKLSIVFQDAFDTDLQNSSEGTKEATTEKSTDKKHPSHTTSSRYLNALQGICEQALHCSFLLRSSTSTCTWSQRGTPSDIIVKDRQTRVKRIQISTTSKKAQSNAIPPFNIFGEVLRLRREPDMEPVRISKPTVAVFVLQ